MMEMKKTIMMSLLNGMVCWILLAFVFSLIHKDTTFVNQLVSTEIMTISICAFAGSIVGFCLKIANSK